MNGITFVIFRQTGSPSESSWRDLAPRHCWSMNGLKAVMWLIVMNVEAFVFYCVWKETKGWWGENAPIFQLITWFEPEQTSYRFANTLKMCNQSFDALWASEGRPAEGWSGLTFWWQYEWKPKPRGSSRYLICCAGLFAGTAISLAAGLPHPRIGSLLHPAN